MCTRTKFFESHFVIAYDHDRQCPLNCRCLRIRCQDFLCTVHRRNIGTALKIILGNVSFVRSERVDEISHTRARISRILAVRVAGYQYLERVKCFARGDRIALSEVRLEYVRHRPKILIEIDPPFQIVGIVCVEVIRMFPDEPIGGGERKARFAILPVGVSKIEFALLRKWAIWKARIELLVIFDRFFVLLLSQFGSCSVVYTISRPVARFIDLTVGTSTEQQRDQHGQDKYQSACIHGAKVKSVNNAANYKGECSASNDRIETVPDEYAGKRIDQVLALLLPEYSRSRLQQWIRKGLVSVDDQPCTGKTKVWGGEKVAVTLQPDANELAFLPEDIPLSIVYEDQSILVVDKPAGLVVHPGSGNWSGTLLNALLQHVPDNGSLPRAGIVHRLDKDTSGLLVVAKSLGAHTDLVRQLQKRSIGREYAALVYGLVAVGGAVDAPIGRHPRDRKRMAVVERGKPARTHYSIEERGVGWTLLRCRLETGRTHQIRVHLSSIDHGLIGDPVYKKGPAPASIPAGARAFPRQALHAQELQIVHPDTGAAMRWTAPLPQDMIELLDCLRNG